MAADSKAKTRLHFADTEQGDESVQRKSPKAANTAAATAREKAVMDASPQKIIRTRLHFTEEELPPDTNPKVAKAAATLDKAKSKIPKRKAMVLARAHDEATGKIKIRLSFEERTKKPPSNHAPKDTHNLLIVKLILLC